MRYTSRLLLWRHQSGNVSKYLLQEAGIRRIHINVSDKDRIAIVAAQTALQLNQC